MDIAALIVALAVKFPIILSVAAVLGSLVVIGQVVVLATPSKDDDAAWEKIQAIPVLGDLLKALVSFAVIQKKEPPAPPAA